MTSAADDEPMRLDAYLDGLLASRSGVDAALAGRDMTPDLERAVAVLRDTLVRFHPSFRFEEDLAARLRAVALGASRVAGVVRFPTGPSAALAPAIASGPEPRHLALPADGPDAIDHTSSVERGWVLVGGAIASGVSLAAGVLLARRRSRADGRWERLA